MEICATLAAASPRWGKRWLFRFTVGALAFFLLVSLGALSGLAAKRTWTGGHATSANWNLRDNWGGIAVPAHGDTLVFPAGAARLHNTNNIPGLRISLIEFSGAGGGYILRGLGLSLSNGITALDDANNTISLDTLTLERPQLFSIALGHGLTVNSDIALNGDFAIAAIGDVTMTGAISGTGHVTKSGVGQLSLSGPHDNTFAGTLRAHSGTLAMNRKEVVSFVPLTYESRIAVPGNLILGNGSGPVEAIAHFEDQIANSSTVTVNESATLNLNGHSNTVGNLVLMGGAVLTEEATLTLSSNITSLASPNPSVISGSLFLAAESTFAVADGDASIDLDILANIGANGIAGFTKTGAGTLRLRGTNTYLGMTWVDGGQLNVGNDSALGTQNGTTWVKTNCQLVLEQTVDVLKESLSLAGAGFGGTNAALRVSGGATLESSVHLTAPATINVPFGSSLTIDGVIFGTGPLTKIGSGTLRLEGDEVNSFTGGMLAEQGLVLLEQSPGNAVPGHLVVGVSGTPDGGSTATVRYSHSSQVLGTVTVNAGSLLDLDGFHETIPGLTLNGGADVQTDDGQLTVTGDVVANGVAGLLGSTSTIDGVLNVSTGTRNFIVAETGGAYDDGDDLVINAVIHGSASIVKTGAGDLSLTASNDFTGSLTVQDGELHVSHGHALGSPAAFTVLTGDSMIRLSGDIEVKSEHLFLNTMGQGALGALSTEGTNTWAGTMFLAQTTVVNVPTNGVLFVSGAINGLSGLTKIGAGVLTYSGTASNTYIGTTRVDEGWLRLDRTDNNYSIPGTLIVGDGLGGPDADIVHVVGPNPQIVNSAAIVVESSGLLIADVTLETEAVGSLAGSGRVQLNNWILQAGVNGDSTVFDGVISGTGDFWKGGAGVLTLNGTNTLTGETRVENGTLEVNGQQLASDVIVMPLGTLSGRGRIGNVLVQGTLAPGNPAGYLRTADVDFSPGSTYAVEVHTGNPNDTHDYVIANNTVDLSGASLELALGSPPYAGQRSLILQKYSAGPINGIFAGLPEGAEFMLNQIPLRISYAGGYPWDGNDVVLTVGELALRLAGTRVEAGNGNGCIEPDECNHLFVAIENLTGAAVNVLSAHVEPLHTGLVVIQSEAAYGSVPPLGFRTNSTPFQIRSAPDYPCGLNARFHLVVDTVGHGRFAIPVTLPTGSPGAFVSYAQAIAPQPIPAVGELVLQRQVTDEFRIGKVRVSLHASHPAAGDLRLRLISPLGTEVVLAANRGGNAANYGGSCANRTIFDDAAPVKIAAAAAPFAGTFAPEGNLADFVGHPSQGDWSLLVEDTVAGDLGTLQCWSLELAPAECAPGGGGCQSCFPAVGGLLDANRTMPHRLHSSFRISGCGDAEPCPGASALPLGLGEPPYRYQTHSFTNDGPDACVSVFLTVPCAQYFSGLHCSAYLGDFDPNNLCANYLGDSGSRIESGSGGFSFRVPAGERYTVVVNEENVTGPFQGCDNYSLELYGLPCPQENPTLHIAKDAGPDKVRLHWSTAYPGFQLQGKPSLGGLLLVNFTNVATPPTVISGEYSVTNTAATNQGFYRLRKP